MSRNGILFCIFQKPTGNILLRGKRKIFCRPQRPKNILLWLFVGIKVQQKIKKKKHQRYLNKLKQKNVGSYRRDKKLSTKFSGSRSLEKFLEIVVGLKFQKKYVQILKLFVFFILFTFIFFVEPEASKHCLNFFCWHEVAKWNLIFDSSWKPRGILLRGTRNFFGWIL